MLTTEMHSNINPSGSLNPLFDPKTDNMPIDPSVQKRMNQATPSASGLSAQDEEFLNKLKELVESGKINTHLPESLLNRAIYDTAPSEVQEKASQNALLMLGRIRSILQLLKFDTAETYQMENDVASLRLYKERLEAYSGDIFII